MRQISSLYRKSLLFALALSLMLGVGVCRPAATASAESPLAEHKDEIVDAIVQAREDLRSTLEDLRAIRDEVRAREAAKAGERAETPTGTEAAPTVPARTEGNTAAGTTPTAPARTEGNTAAGTTPAAPAEADTASGGDSLRETIRSTVQTRMAELEFEQTKEAPAEQSGQTEKPAVSDAYNDQSQQKTTTRSSGDSLISIDISDVTATLKDNPIEHNVPVNVFSNNKHFSDNTIVHQRVYESQRYAPSYGPNEYTYSTAPKTGDANNIGLWVAVVGVSAAALAATLILLKKRSKK